MHNKPFEVHVLQADIPQFGNKIYPSDVVEKAVRAFNDREFPCLCDVYAQPKPPSVEQLSHIVRRLKFIEGDVIAEIELLDTKTGNILGEMLDVLGEDKFNFRMAAQCSLKNRKIVNSDLIFTGVSITPTGK